MMFPEDQDGPEGSIRKAGTADASSEPPATISSEQVFGDKVGQDKIGRDKIVAQQYIARMIVGEEAVDWDSINFSGYLKRASFLFVDHMRRFAGTADSEGADRRYLALRLQDGAESEKVIDSEQGPTAERSERHRQRWSGFWNDRVTYPNKLFLSGDAGSGKTTLLLYECRRLSAEAINNSAAPIPVYLPLRRFSNWSRDLLLQRLAEETGLGLREVKGLWQEKHRPLCLFLDGADEIPAEELDNFANTIAALDSLAPENYHSLTISYRPDQNVSAFQNRIGWPRVNLLPLDESQLRSLLGRYDIPGLERYLDSGLQELLQTPDLLSALALSWQQATGYEMPRNMGEIYQLYVDKHLFARDRGLYDYQRVKRRILAFFAYNMVTHNRANWLFAGTTEDQILEILRELDSYYRNRRRVMPEDWSVQGLLEELDASPVFTVEERGSDKILMTFTKAGYRDYYAAVYIAQQEQWEDQFLKVDQDSWLPVLLILSGITPSGNQLFDQIYGQQPALAADLWLENRPVGLRAPEVIRRSVMELDEYFKRLLGDEIIEPLTARLLVRLMNAAEPRVRLEAIGALSQWGAAGIEPLLDAASDDHPLLAATALYALLHMGETILENGRERPLPPLLQGDSSFYSVGGCNLTAGPIAFVSGPQSMRVKLRVDVGEWDIDLFTQPVTAELWSMPPDWLVAEWVEREGKVDWPVILARLVRISNLANRARNYTWGSASRDKLGNTLASRQAVFATVAYLLARDLGLEGYAGLEPGSGPEAEFALQVYKRMRFLYSLTNREHSIASSDAANVDQVAVNLSIGSAASAEIYGGQMLDDAPPAPEGDDRFKVYNFNISADKLASSTLAGLYGHKLVEPDQRMPQLIRVQTDIKVGEAASSTVSGVLFENLQPGAGGLLFDIKIRVGKFYSSELVGLVVGKS